MADPRYPGLYRYRNGVWYQRRPGVRGAAVSLRTRSKREAVARRQAVLDRWAAAGAPGAGDGRTLVSVAGEQWLCESVEPVQEGRNAAMRRSRWERVLAPFFGRLRLSDVSARLLFELRRDLEGRGFKPETVRHYLRDVRRMLTWCTMDGVEYLTRSPFPRDVMPRRVEEIPETFSDEELAAILATPVRYARVCAVALVTAARWSDTRAIQYQHYDRSTGLLRYVSPKTGRLLQLAVPEAFGELFGAQDVGPINPYGSWSTSSFNRAVTRHSGVPFHVHKLRATAITGMLEAGLSQSVVMEIAGIKGEAILRRYGRARDDAIITATRAAMGPRWDGVLARVGGWS